MVVVVQHPSLTRVRVGQHIDVFVHQDFMDKIVIQVGEIILTISFFLKNKFSSAISSCASMICPSYKICSEQPTGPICTCSGGKVGTFCQYSKNENAYSHSAFVFLFR
jgi:hypothetical protein